MKVRLIFATSFVLLYLAHFAVAGEIAFKPPQSYPVGSNPIWVVTGDFNNDGRRDLAVINQGDASVGDPGGVSILFGNGDGTFQPAKNIAIGKNCTNAVAGDLDGDGNLDLALLRPGDPTVNDDGDVTIFLGNGDGTFRQGQVLTPGKNPSWMYFSLAAADFNGDQRLDLVVANPGDKTFSVMLGNGNGTFQSPVAYTVVSPPYSIFVADLAGSGEKDLVVSGIATVNLWFGNGDGTFRQGSSVGAKAILVGDFNEDKKADLVTQAFVLCLFPPCPPVYPAVALGNGDGTFQSAVNVGQPVTMAGDFDGDGKSDLAGNGRNGSQIQILQSNGDGTFQPSITVNSNGELSQVLDVNGDGAPDLVTIGSNSIGVLVNVGTDFSISATVLTPSILSAGQSTTSMLTVKLLSNFNNPVSLSCSVQPSAGGPTCSLSSNSLTFDGSGNASATLTVNAGSSAAWLANPAKSHTFRGLGLWFPVVGFAFLGSGFGVGLSRKRRLLIVLAAAVLFAGLIVQTACGGGNSSASKSTAYTVTITGTSGATQHSTTVSLTVR